MDNTTYYQRNREIMLNKAKRYYETDKERLREQARNNYRNLSEEDKNKKKNIGKTDILQFFNRLKTYKILQKIIKKSSKSNNVFITLPCHFYNNICHKNSILSLSITRKSY